MHSATNKRICQNDLISVVFAPLNKFRVIPLHLMYRPANTIPYATVETDLDGEYVKYCVMDSTGRLIARATSEVEQKCCTFQHWIHQWTNGNLLVTRLEGKKIFTYYNTPRVLTSCYIKCCILKYSCVFQVSMQRLQALK